VLAPPCIFLIAVYRLEASKIEYRLKIKLQYHENIKKRGKKKRGRGRQRDRDGEIERNIKHTDKALTQNQQSHVQNGIIAAGLDGVE